MGFTLQLAGEFLSHVETPVAMDAATRLIKAISKGEKHPAAALVLATDAAVAPWEEIERDTEKALTKLARKLPAHAWVKDVHGFGELSFARIIAETGDLSGYDNPAKAWKRLGLAVIDGRAQRKARDKEKAAEQGYSPRRRSVSWVAFHSLWLAQSTTNSGGHNSREAHEPVAAGASGAGHNEVEAQAAGAGPYRRLYDAKKAEYLARVEAGEEGWTTLRANRAAKRYAEKRLLRDLWVAWREDAGQSHRDAHLHDAGDGARGALKPAGVPANRRSSGAAKRTGDIAGQPNAEAHTSSAGDGDRGGQDVADAHECRAAPVASKRKRDIAGHLLDEAHDASAGDGDWGGHSSSEAQIALAAPVAATTRAP